jgi:hypothetical protein
MATVPFSFHNDMYVGGALDLPDPTVRLAPRRTTIVDRDLSYRVFTHFHPYVAELVRELIERSVRGLQAADTDYQRTADGTVVSLPDGKPLPTLYEELFTANHYDPSDLVEEPHPVKDLDFSPEGAYSVYNWELFYHVPITIGIHLSRNQRFEDAQRWFHLVFDPTDAGRDPVPDRFWKVRPFHNAEVIAIEAVLANLSSGTDPDLLARTVASIEAWKNAPFRPHLVARYRQSAYMVKAVTAYLDNLISWGDALFRQDTGESVNEATQLYVMAANILGPRPQEVPRKGWQRPLTYANMRADLDEMGNTFGEVEVDIPFDVLPHPTEAADGAPLATLRSLAGALYFCVPRNDKLLGYWGTVADRLFKIRNSLNLQGIFRQLPLFEPPIDPALLAKGAAAGLDVGAILAGLNQPLPLVRFSVLVAKAAEICQEVKALGGHLLSAIEKEDGESLSILRARHEKVVLGLAEVVRYEQWQEAIKAREALEKSFGGMVARFTYYERLLGTPDNEIAVPELDALDTAALEKMKFKSTEPEVGPRPIEVDIASDLSGAEGKKISTYEARELDLLSQAQTAEDVAGGLAAAAATAGLVPQFEAAAKPMGAGAGVHFGGVNLHQAASAGAAVSRILAARKNYAANLSAKIGSYARREQEWAFQRNAVAGEITQVYKQWRAAQIREAIAEREWRNHQQQIRHAEEIERFLTDERNGKTSNKQLYAWLRREVRGLYGQCFQLAFDVAKKAERALQHELGDPKQTFLQFGYQSGKQGLLAGEKLYLDLKRMEMAYHELNQREYELTKHVSLRQIDAVALLTLRATGSCEFTLPEELFDLDCPGHYFRRIRSVALSIPCVVGPYSSVNATLTLQSSTVRTSPALGDDGYARAGDDTERFSDHFGGVQSVVTSSGNQDSGLFETNLRDERFLPFEGSGAVGHWRLELPAELPQFDHDSISDVVLHVRYTAREGGLPLRTAAVGHLAAQAAAEEAAGSVPGSVRLLSLRHEFPTSWARFTAVRLDDETVEAPLAIELRAEHYPFWASAFESLTLHRVELFADSGSEPNDVLAGIARSGESSREEITLAKGAGPGDLLAGALEESLPPAIGAFTLYLGDNGMKDIWLALTWGAQE